MSEERCQSVKYHKQMEYLAEKLLPVLNVHHTYMLALATHSVAPYTPKNKGTAKGEEVGEQWELHSSP
jgi:hypothetical protein